MFRSKNFILRLIYFEHPQISEPNDIAVVKTVHQPNENKISSTVSTSTGTAVTVIGKSSMAEETRANELKRDEIEDNKQGNGTGGHFEVAPNQSQGVAISEVKTAISLLTKCEDLVCQDGKPFVDLSSVQDESISEISMMSDASTPLRNHFSAESLVGLSGHPCFHGLNTGEEIECGTRQQDVQQADLVRVEKHCLVDQ
ncbi:unnamed protein product [Protopolystoma xenopodis]|uniref:Uncharacterized protein n=1 Tax=Protopolystoma xenopodis TaxID=117903 RepID=A0A3S5CQV9_9PLAT|nr:unnamed protein product [Protopolystoma xenopodis]